MVMPRKSTPLGDFERPATPMAVDFSSQRELYYARNDAGKMFVVNSKGIPFERGAKHEVRVMPEEEKMDGSPHLVSMSRKQQRARARRRLRAGIRMTDEAWDELYKPLDEWDDEELARGRPRDEMGKFNGPVPKYITRELHERAMERFKTLVRSEMNAHSIKALRTIQMVLESEEVDEKGKPVVGAAAKMDAAKFLLEHIVGKPTQPTTTDVSVKLQGILGTVMVNPSDPMVSMGQYIPAHTGSRELEASEDYDEDE